MASIAVIYWSQYGATERYARWLAEDLGADLIRTKKVRPSDVDGRDAVVVAAPIVGASLRLKGIEALKRKLAGTPLAVCTVGLSPVASSGRDEAANKALGGEPAAHEATFHLPGAIDYDRLTVMHRTMMTMVRKQQEKAHPERPAPPAVSQDLVSRDAIGPVVTWAREAAALS